VIAPSGADRPVVNAMTIDVEDYFHVSAFEGVVARDRWDQLESRVCANTERLLRIFQAHDVRATFFVLGRVAEQFPALVADIVAAGHEIASHGYDHRLVYQQTSSAFREDVRRAKGQLEALSGRAVEGYRAPSYSITARTPWAFDVLIEEGHRYDASVFPIRHDRYGIPDAPRHAHVISRAAGSLVETPGSTVRLGPVNIPMAGGGYFRLLPYWWTRWGISRVNQRERLPAIFYLHPWELDTGQPRLPASRLSRFRHYRNLHRTEDRLRQLLTDFRFDTLPVAIAAVKGASSADEKVA
jgi:polysaccharide deacetylase family protein (PEP-CTERM system associated)